MGDDVDDDAASGTGFASPGAITTETLPAQNSESPPSAQDVDAATAAESSPGLPEVANDPENNGTSDAAEDAVSAGAGDSGVPTTHSAGEPPADGSMSASAST